MDSRDNRAIIKASGSTATPVWDEVDATEKYTEVVGFAPEYGKKYFCEFWWMDKETGFYVSSVICPVFTS